MEHTRGPWAVFNGIIYDSHQESNSLVIAQQKGNMCVARIIWLSGKIDDTDKANAQRIVACVNACDGISTEALEAGIVKGLLEVARALLMHLDDMTTDEFAHGGEREEREALRQVIAKAEGKE